MQASSLGHIGHQHSIHTISNPRLRAPPLASIQEDDPTEKRITQSLARLNEPERFLLGLGLYFAAGTSYRSIFCAYSALSFGGLLTLLSIASSLSLLSFGSLLSLGSAGSVLSFASVGSIMSIGCVGGVLEYCW